VEIDTLPLRSARQRMIERLERVYVTRALARARGNVAEAARGAGVDRGTFFRMIRRYRLKEPGSS
jgi:transcriptional regulator of acetoin/glycerol metabolism